jgi:hypothetical protein
MDHTHTIPFDLFTLIIFEDYKLWSSSLCISLRPSVTPSFRAKHFSKCPVSIHPPLQSESKLWMRITLNIYHLICSTTSLWADVRGTAVRFAAGARYFSLLEFRGPPSRWITATLSQRIKEQRSEAGHFPPPISEVKNARRYISTRP